MLQRLLKKPADSFFLFGPRGVGKSTWLNRHFSNNPTFNLLKNETYLELSRNPSVIEARIGNKPKGSWICIDEVQKLPALLDEVHRLMEEKKYRFALSGSSARKLKKGGANLLAGRAITLHMEQFSFAEIKHIYNLDQVLQWGLLPLVVLKPELRGEILNTYVHTYLREEIKEEGLVRKVEPFVRFLEIAAILNGGQLNIENIARDAKVPRPTVDTYVSILQDTLVVHKLPAYRPQIKVREQASPKLYWFDPGVARGAAGLLFDVVDPAWLGLALETVVFHELRTYNASHQKHRSFYYYKTSAGAEIDFIIETKKRLQTNKPELVCIEVKHAKKWDRKWEKAMRNLAQSPKVKVKKMLGIYRGTEAYHFDGVDVLPVTKFFEQLHEGKFF